jgi:hypothetical protein
MAKRTEVDKKVIITVLKPSDGAQWGPPRLSKFDADISFASLVARHIYSLVQPSSSINMAAPQFAVTLDLSAHEHLSRHRSFIPTAAVS